jgi:NAD(P)-dependent dehydrogenase (short-subunit alcohol dehydrogenase family)
MSRIFITGSTEGLGRAAAEALIDDGHEVILHARSPERAAALDGLGKRSGGLVVGDLGSAAQTRDVADQVNALGRMDAIIHNAGIYSTADRGPAAEGHATIFAVNSLAPYMLTALIDRPSRLVYLSSSLHRGGKGSDMQLGLRIGLARVPFALFPVEIVKGALAAPMQAAAEIDEA